jgi:hypothetical protein
MRSIRRSVFSRLQMLWAWAACRGIEHTWTMRHDKIRTNCHIHITSDIQVIEVTAIDIQVAGSLEHTYRKTNAIMLARWMIGITHWLHFEFGCLREQNLRGLTNWHVRWSPCLIQVFQPSNETINVRAWASLETHFLCCQRSYGAVDLDQDPMKGGVISTRNAFHKKVEIRTVCNDRYIPEELVKGCAGQAVQRQPKSPGSWSSSLMIRVPSVSIFSRPATSLR